VFLDWSKWQLSGDEPELMQFAEPEDVLLSGNHDEMVAEQVGEIYEVQLERDGLASQDFDATGNIRLWFKDAPEKDYDLFYAATPGGYTRIVGSGQLISRLPETALRWLQILPITAGRQ